MHTLGRRRLRADTSGVALIEFAFTLPILLAIGVGGLELANLSLANLRVSHAAIDLADNAARMGHQSTSTGFQTLTEADISDAFQAMRQEKPDLTANGRVTISSVEARTDAKGNTAQFLHWQRCLGTPPVHGAGLGWDSSYGTAPYDDSGINVKGIGPATPGAPNGLTAPGTSTGQADSMLIFIEVNYSYTSLFASLPILGSILGGARKLHYISSMIVRQNRSTNDLIDDSANLPRLTCDKYTT